MGNIRESRFVGNDGLSKDPLASPVEAFEQYLTERGYVENTFAMCIGGIIYFAPDSLMRFLRT